MKAMILAAGLGTRLKPLTDKIPKALVEVDGVPMLERVILSLKSQGFDKFVVNVHHFSSQVKEFLKNRDYGVEIKISDETEQLLDTGGGILFAKSLLFKEDSSPVLIHNVDILSNANLKTVLKTSEKWDESLLLVSDRESSRKLIFDRQCHLAGWHDLKNNMFRPENFEFTSDFHELAFSGIYSMSQEAIEEMEFLMGCRKFSIMDYFFNPERKSRIKSIHQENLKLLDIGKPAILLQAPELLSELNKNSN